MRVLRYWKGNIRGWLKWILIMSREIERHGESLSERTFKPFYLKEVTTGVI